MSNKPKLRFKEFNGEWKQHEDKINTLESELKSYLNELGV